MSVFQTMKIQSPPVLAGRVKLMLVSLMTMISLVGSASAVTMDFNGITVVMTNLTNVILPEFLNLVIAYLPIAVTLILCVELLYQGRESRARVYPVLPG